MRLSLHHRLIRRRMMFKDASNPLASSGASEAAPLERGGGSATGGRLPLQDEIGFVGLGHMGTAMAANLAIAGPRVIAYVRRPEQIGRLMALGLQPTTDITDLFDCKVVISMLPDDAAVSDVVFGREDLGSKGLAAGLRPGAIHLSMSTISTAAASRLAGEHARRGQGYVAAPVFGNPDAAKARQLFIIVAGAPADVARCQPLFDRLGQQMFGGRVHRIYGDRIVRQHYAAGFVMPLALKDVRLALAEAENAGAPMPSVSVVRDRMMTAIGRGHADLDWTALGLIAAEEAGLRSPPTPQAPEEGARS
jgi:3-hydroxyisobutyrate dehydrogenase-like beta-hydroxyacid dehydrogenase